MEPKREVENWHLRDRLTRSINEWETSFISKYFIGFSDEQFKDKKSLWVKVRRWM